MRLKLSPILIAEILALVGSIGLAVGLILKGDDAHSLVPLSAEALSIGPGQERWFGIFLEENHVGFSVSRSSPAQVPQRGNTDGILYEQRTSFRMPVSGTIQHVVTASAALVDDQSQLVRFDFFMSTDLATVSVRGEVFSDSIEVEMVTAGEVSSLSLPIDEPPHVALSLESVIQNRELSIGDRFQVPFFDPLTMAQDTMRMTVDDLEVLPNGEEAWWLSTSFLGTSTRVLVTTAGEIVRQEGSIGMALVRMTPSEAQNVPALQTDTDLISLAAAPIDKKIPRHRKLRHMELIAHGIDSDMLHDQAPLQRIDDSHIFNTRADLSSLPELPVADRSEPAWVSATWTLPVGHEDIREKAREIVGDATTRLEAVHRLHKFVDSYVANVPNIGVPHGLAVLQSAQGDCNEHTALFVSLARAAGIPSRIAAGLVYSTRAGPQPAFYYHAWPEVRLGGEMDWVPIDPTLSQFPADVTHIKLVEGDLDRQVEIMAFMGRISFELVDVE